MENLSVNPENYKILVVDDIATNVLLLKTILGKAGYRIVTATGGREALEKVESESPDLILLDIMMPDMNGYEVIERLKADERFCRIPVIFLSALHDSENIVKGFKMGASDYVSKPFNHEELITRVAHHMFIAEAQRVIVRQNEELQATLASRDKMYSVIAHDLRSPIGSLKMLFNTLLDSLDAERVGAGNLDMLRMGNDIAEDTFSLLDNLLKWTKCQTGRMHTVYQDVDLAEVVLFSSKISESVARTKGIVVEYDIPAPIHVRCDVDMVKTIVRNLLSNAIKYSPEGGGKIIVSLENSHPETRHQGVMFCSLWAFVTSSLTLNSQQFLQHLIDAGGICLAFHCFHGLTYQETDGFLFAVVVVLHRLRVRGNDFLHDFTQCTFVIDGLQSLLFHILFRIDIFLKHHLEYFFCYRRVNNLAIYQRDQPAQMLR